MSGTLTTGTRIRVPTLEPGEYGYFNGCWYACTPVGIYANLSNHQVTEHDDGTITVAPSILVTQGNQTWHGWLERGVWREA
jgi:hypothetical protein